MNFKMTPFARAAFTRAVKTMAQTAVSLVGVGSLMSDIDWVRVLSASVLSGVLSVLTSVATDLPEAPAASTGLPEASAVPVTELSTGGDAQ